jgi:hypothetical protein
MVDYIPFTIKKKDVKQFVDKGFGCYELKVGLVLGCIIGVILGSVGTLILLGNM